MDASYKIQRGIHVHLIQFFMCPEFWVHISNGLLRFSIYCTGLPKRFELFFNRHAIGTPQAFPEISSGPPLSTVIS